MDLQLDGMTALVTGAGTGIGLEITRVLAAEGVRVAIVGRREELLRSVAAELPAAPGREPVVIPYDLTTPDAGTTVATVAEEQLGGVDILVNNAGTSQPVGIGAPESAWSDAYALRVVATRQLAEALRIGIL